MVERTPADLSYTAIRQMAPAIVARLRQCFPKKYFGIERVPSTLTIDEYKRVVRLSPFIGYAWVGLKRDPANGRLLKGKMQWRLTLIVRASNGLEARFEGDHSDIGLDAMVDVACALFQGHLLINDGREIGTVHITDAQSVFAQGHEDDDTAIAHINFEVDFTTALRDLKLIDGDDFSALDVTWTMTDPDTAEGDPDISQTVTPPQEA